MLVTVALSTQQSYTGTSALRGDESTMLPRQAQTGAGVQPRGPVQLAA